MKYQITNPNEIYVELWMDGTTKWPDADVARILGYARAGVRGDGRAATALLRQKLLRPRVIVTQKTVSIIEGALRRINSEVQVQTVPIKATYELKESEV